MRAVYIYMLGYTLMYCCLIYIPSGVHKPPPHGIRICTSLTARLAGMRNYRGHRGHCRRRRRLCAKARIYTSRTLPSTETIHIHDLQHILYKLHSIVEEHRNKENNIYKIKREREDSEVYITVRRHCYNQG